MTIDLVTLAIFRLMAIGFGAYLLCLVAYLFTLYFTSKTGDNS